jgi:hypothetical protein
MDGSVVKPVPGCCNKVDAQIDEIETHIQSHLNGRVRDFHLVLRSQGLVLQGHAHTYHAKQLAQHAVSTATNLPILANEIEVS